MLGGASLRAGKPQSVSLPCQSVLRSAFAVDCPSLLSQHFLSGGEPVHENSQIASRRRGSGRACCATRCVCTAGRRWHRDHHSARCRTRHGDAPAGSPGCRVERRRRVSSATYSRAGNRRGRFRGRADRSGRPRNPTHFYDHYGPGCSVFDANDPDVYADRSEHTGQSLPEPDPDRFYPIVVYGYSWPFAERSRSLPCGSDLGRWRGLHSPYLPHLNRWSQRSTSNLSHAFDRIVPRRARRRRHLRRIHLVTRQRHEKRASSGPSPERRFQSRGGSHLRRSADSGPVDLLRRQVAA